MLLGMARGAVGDVVFSRLKGQQVSRARNRKPSNPRTSSQMYQRALFSDAVKFYTRGRRNLFQFAFEDKKENESDYNAFMRVNAKRGVVISKAAFDNYPYPALGNFIMSKGTLPPTSSVIGTGTDSTLMQLTKSVQTDLTAVTTVSQLTSLLVDGVEYLQDDILTFVMIGFDAETVPNVDGTVQSSTVWKLAQVQLTNSSQPISDFGITATIMGTGASQRLFVSTTESISDSLCFAGCVIHSRNTASKVIVSTEELKLSTEAEAAIEAAREHTYIDAVVESWRAVQQAPVVSEAVMQGSIAQSIALDFNPSGE